MLGNVRSVFQMIFDESIINHMKMCIEAEARRVWRKEWTITKSRLYAFLSILYAREAYEVKSLKASYL